MCFLCCWTAAAIALSAGAQADGISSYGTPGLIDMPSATATRDGTLSWTTSLLPDHTRNSLHFQITPRLSGVFRYSILRGYDQNEDRFDRSFDVHYLMREESAQFPALAIGLRDFGGTGLFASEYLVASKHFLDSRLTVSGGIGWGRLGSFGRFSNPLGVIDDRFDTRPGPIRDINETGRVSFNHFFRGDAALFGGIEYQASERLRLAVEYSSDAYTEEVKRMGFEHRTPLNFGLDYRATKNLTFKAFVIGGAQAGFGLTYVIDPRAPQFPGGIERNTPALMPQADIVALGWKAGDIDSSRSRLSRALKVQGLDLESYAESDTTARVVLANPTYPNIAEALGRAARVMANTLPAALSTFEITLAVEGMPTSSSTFRRADLHTLETAWDGSWQSFVRADIADAPTRLAPDAGSYPRLNWALTPYYSTEFFDPDNPLRIDFGAQASLHYTLAPGVSLTAVVRQKAFGTLDQSTRLSDSVLPHVRSDAALYDKFSGPRISILTADYLFRPASALYGRLSAGYFEAMFAGVSGELLWYPQGSRLALGAELNYLGQRDPESRLGLTDYRVASGHLSAYYDFGQGYRGEIDAGRYLAKDWGATISFDREFDNGFRVGAFFTLTDVSFDDFGEGSFDKGIRLSIPISWLSGEPGRGALSQTVRPIQRDGGARVEIANRLYEQVRGTNESEMQNQWGKFWR
ncbi:YjbH domain-containing protein [Sinirhodobacter huangdaonensis]|nr:YjbH domain-containing protein [Sinirhodobacter huangdaonensis]